MRISSHGARIVAASQHVTTVPQRHSKRRPEMVVDGTHLMAKYYLSNFQMVASFGKGWHFGADGKGRGARLNDGRTNEPTSITPVATDDRAINPATATVADPIDGGVLSFFFLLSSSPVIVQTHILRGVRIRLKCVSPTHNIRTPTTVTHARLAARITHEWR